MQTWREVVVEARARGTFSWETYQRWQNMLECPAAEQAKACGALRRRARPGEFGALSLHSPWSALWKIGDEVGPAIMRNDFQAVEDLLDKLEELALGLKREGL